MSEQPTRDLRATLEQLQRELEAEPELDASLREELRATAEEIRDALDPETERELHASLRERLSELTLEFEESHPGLVRLAGRVVNALSQLGI